MNVNLYGLQRLTLGLIPKLAEGASTANLASLAGSGWPNSVDQIKAALALTLNSDVAALCADQGLTDAQGGRSYFLSKEALIVWTIQNRWTWRDRAITMNCISPGPVDTPILPDFLATLGNRAEEDSAAIGPPRQTCRSGPRGGICAQRRGEMVRGREPDRGRGHVGPYPVQNPPVVAAMLTSRP
jgi:NAD(P)-dependent dehydrogenase (short-subunit alcohol dehydrogenase family)